MVKIATTMRDDRLPLQPPPQDNPPQKNPPAPAPAWVAFLAAWLGLIVLAASIIFLFLPGSRDPVAELQHRAPYSLKDRFLPYPIYGIAVALFVGIIVLWQMRKEPRPLPDALVSQRLQAWAGITLSLLAAVIIYTYVAWRGPR